MLPSGTFPLQSVVFLKSVKSGMLPQTGISFVSAASALCWLTHLAPMPSEQGIPKISARPRQRVPLIPPQGRECSSAPPWTEPYFRDTFHSTPRALPYSKTHTNA
jgi:hypothetical protein